MIRLGFSARDRRTATLGITVVGSLIGLSRGLRALTAWEETRVAEASDATARLSSARANVRLLSVLRDSLRARLERLAAADSVLLTGTSSAAAAADLASLLDEAGRAARLRITAMQLRADSAAQGSITRVAVRVTGTTDVRGLASFLRSIEGNDTPLAIRELVVSQPEPAAPDSKPETLRVDIAVEGLARILVPRRI
jgi:Type II secretion system (T2SS), protein M subtype b